MNKILIVHLTIGLGLHFFDWSLNFLSNGQVIDNPLNNGQAHKHIIKVVRTPDDLSKYHNSDANVLILQSVGVDTLFDSKPSKDSHTHEGREKLKSKSFDTQIKIIQAALNQGFRVVVVDWAQHHWLIPSYQKRFNTIFFTNQQITREEQNTQWIKLFFPDAEENWKQKSIWDQRELLAVCMRPKTLAKTFATDIKTYFNNSVDYITTDRLWYNLDCVVSEYISINTNKMQQWSKVYDQWKLVHDVDFSQDYKLICSDIVTGQNRDLMSYKIDFTKEALIQHAMIYAYDLNFKTWDLDKFPSNTLDLHRLLEPNIHTRSFTYIDL